MALKIKEKQAIVYEVAEVANCACALVTAEYSGLPVALLMKLRFQARESGVYLRVVKNTLAHRALENTQFACIQPTLRGPLILAFSRSEPSSAARLLRSFSQENQQLVVKALAFEGQAFTARELNKLADLPTREEALARLVGVMNAVPAKFIRTVVEPGAKFVRTVIALSKSRT